MSYPELLDLVGLRDKWVAVDPNGLGAAPRGPAPLAELPSGAVVVDYDEEIDELCRRVAASERTSLTIVYCGRLPRA